MAIEEIKEIKSSEEKAYEVIKNAQNERGKIIKEAKIKALNEYKRILSEAKLQAKKIIDDSVKEAEKKKIPILEQGQKESQSIINISDEKFKKAVNLVIERIVNVNGNS